MADETWKWPEYGELLILDGGLDHRTSVDECPKCAAIVLTENRTKHEAVCWGPEESRPKDPFVSVPERPALAADAFRELVNYSRLVETQLRLAPELGRHVVTESASVESGRSWTILRTHAYGADYKITIERQ